MQNTTKSAEIAAQKITLICAKMTITRNFHKLRRTGGLLSKMENLPDEQFMNLELDLYRPDAPEEEKA